MSASFEKSVRACATGACLLAAAPALAQEPLTLERYIAIVLRSHPATRTVSGLEGAARAERKAARLLPDPSLELTRGRARPSEASSARATETGIALTQSIPWPGSFVAGIRAGDRAAQAFRAESVEVRWEIEIEARRAFARLLAARALAEIARGNEQDARALRDFVARRTELGETREADRIKASVEWLKQSRLSRAAAREAEAAEAVLRVFAVEALPSPLSLDGALPSDAPPLDPVALGSRLAAANPRLLAAQSRSRQQEAVASQARQGWLPGFELTLFRDTELDKTSQGFSLGLTLPLWNANRGEAARARAAWTLVSADEARLGLDLRADLERRMKDLEVAGAQAALLENEILPAAAEGLRLARRTYEEGETSLLDLLDTQRTHRDTQREAVEARLALALAFADLQQLVGPDFDPWR